MDGRDGIMPILTQVFGMITLHRGVFWRNSGFGTGKPAMSRQKRGVFRYCVTTRGSNVMIGMA